MFCRICLLVVVLLFTGGQTQECHRCPNGFTYFPRENKCYYVIPVKVIWDVAFGMCNQIGAHLAVVKNAEARAALLTAITPFKDTCRGDFLGNDVSYFWTAGRRTSTECPPFKWSTGSGTHWDIGYTDWLKGQPDDYLGKEDCIHLVYNKDMYGWNDVTCFYESCALCEIDV